VICAPRGSINDGSNAAMGGEEWEDGREVGQTTKRGCVRRKMGGEKRLSRRVPILFSARRRAHLASVLECPWTAGHTS